MALIPFNYEDAINWWQAASVEEREEFLHALLQDGDAEQLNDTTWEVRP